MKIEYQITFDHIEGMIAEQLSLAPIQHAKPIELAGGQLSLDELELGETRLRGHYGSPHSLLFHTDNGATAVVLRKLRFEQDALAYLVPNSERNNANADKQMEMDLNGDRDVSLQTPLPLVLELDVAVQLSSMLQPERGSTTQMRMTHAAAIEITLAGIIGLPTDKDIELPAYRSMIPLEINTIAALLGSTSNVTGAAMVASKEHDFVSVRIQLGELTVAEEAQWSRFLKGEVNPRLRSRQWAMFVDNENEPPPFSERRPMTETISENDVMPMTGVNLMWRRALQRAGENALVWIARNEYVARLLDLGDNPVSARSFEASTEMLEKLPELHNDRARILVMRLD